MRPEYRPTTEDAKKVIALAGAGWPERDIAAALGIARMTMRKHFADELRSARIVTRAEVIASLYAAAIARARLMSRPRRRGSP